ncbi:MAG: hypothetical protein ACYC8T_09115 [Myxococcaceae bacterium]
MRTLTLALVILSLNAAQAGAPTRPAAPEEPGRLSRVEACQKRFVAVCHVLHRCAPWAQDTGGANCEGIDSGCDRLAGQSPSSLQAVSACVASLEVLTCPAKASLDPNDPATLDFEAKTPACQALAAAEAKAVAKDALASRGPRSR